jgi:molybdopterin-dependent oxidoreductase alpha subunit
LFLGNFIFNKLLPLKHKTKAMTKNIKHIPAAHSPEKFSKIKIRPAKKNSVGLDSLTSSAFYMKEYMKPLQVPKLISKMNQKGGFDCPGCAWPDPDGHRSAIGELCENGVKAIAEEATKRRIKAPFFERYTLAELADKTDFELGKSGRLTQPMYLPKGKQNYEPISWQEAYDVIGEELNGLDSPDEAIFYTSGRSSDEAAFMYQLFVRAYGTNNLPDCSNMCHESSGKALSETVGIGKGSVTLEDLHDAELVIVMGQNPGTNHPRMLSSLEACKENGGKIITINPLEEAGLVKFTHPQKPIKLLRGGTILTDIFLQVNINGDTALLKAIMYRLWKKEQENEGKVFDHDFIAEYTSGFESFMAELKKIDYNECVKLSGVAEELIEEAAEMIANKKRIIICWAMGITQHQNGVENIREIVNILLLKGSIGIKGGGTCPVRGHSNVQGDRTVGIWEAPPQAFLDRIKERFNFTPPQKHGFDVVAAINAMYEKRAKVFFALGGNFLSATPDTNYTAEALQNTNLTVHISTKLNRSHLITGEHALILPCLGRTEIDVQKSGKQFVSVENSMGVVSSSEGVLEPASNNLKSEIDIVCSVAAATLGKKINLDWLGLKDDYHLIRDLIEDTIDGFKDFNKRVKQPAGFYLPNGARERQFNTSDKKAHFTVNPLPNIKRLDTDFLLMTIRSHDQFNTTIYGMNDRYRGIYNERRVLFMNKEDMKAQKLKQGDVVNLRSNFDGTKREAPKFKIVEYAIPKGNLACYFPEANVLVPIDYFANISRTPAYKSVPVSLFW